MASNLNRIGCIRVEPWKFVARILCSETLPLHHGCHFILAQPATDAVLRPYPIGEYLPATWTPPLSMPPGRRQVNDDPADQQREADPFAHLHFRNQNSQWYKSHKQHHDQIPP